MNARQKAKKYKRELEILKKQTVKPLVITENRRIETYYIERNVEADGTLATVPDDWIYNDMLKELARDENFKKLFRCDKKYIPSVRSCISDRIKYSMRIDIAVTGDGKR